MTTIDFIRLKVAPRWVMNYPTCSACSVDLDTDGDGWTCPCCGTSWSMTANDGDTGELYASWAGEQATGPEVSEGDAWRWGDYFERLDRHKRMPDLFPKPKEPTA